jgi:hypothetical protein
MSRYLLLLGLLSGCATVNLENTLYVPGACIAHIDEDGFGQVSVSLYKIISTGERGATVVEYIDYPKLGWIETIPFQMTWDSVSNLAPVQCPKKK